jgi:hypothetical protein
MREENKIAKALAIFNRQPKKLAALIQADRERAALLSRIREIWRRMFEIDIDAKRKAAGLSSLEDHLRDTRPTPLADALLAEIEAIPKPDEKRAYREPHEFIGSETPGITQDEVFRVFGFKAPVILTDEEIKETLGDSPLAKVKLGGCEHCSKDSVPGWRRGGKIVKRTWPDGRIDHCCSFCGRSRGE